jgi:RNA polymerase sigma-70 factor (ECF subfamily)
MPGNTYAVNDALREYQAYLETLTFIQIDPRVRCKFGLSDVVQATLLKAWQDLEHIQALDAEGRKRWLRRMHLNDLVDQIRRHLAKKCDARREQSLDAAAAESACQIQKQLAAEDSSPSQRLAQREREEQLEEALSQLDVRQREALILQRYHGWTLAQIAEHLDCTVGAVAGLHARALENLRHILPDPE